MSRRVVLTASMAGPALRGMGIAQIDGSHRDAVLAKAAERISERERFDEMTRQWQRLETQVFQRARQLGVEIEQAVGSRFPEVRMMRILDEHKDVAYSILGDLAHEASAIRAIGLEGALAKIDLGLRVQGRYSWQDHALQLIEGGVSDLRALRA